LGISSAFFTNSDPPFLQNFGAEATITLKVAISANNDVAWEGFDIEESNTTQEEQS